MKQNNFVDKDYYQLFAQFSKFYSQFKSDIDEDLCSFDSLDEYKGKLARLLTKNEKLKSSFVKTEADWCQPCFLMQIKVNGCGEFFFNFF